MAQLVERSLPISEVRGSNPVVTKILQTTYFLLPFETTKIKIKVAGNGQLKIAIDNIIAIYLAWLLNTDGSLKTS